MTGFYMKCTKKLTYGSNWIRTHDHLVRRQTLNHLAKLAKWLAIWLYVLISYHACVSEGTYTLDLPECLGTPCSKQAIICFDNLLRACCDTLLRAQSSWNVFKQVKETLLRHKHTLHKKWSFPLGISSVNVTKSAGNCGFGHTYWRNP